MDPDRGDCDCGDERGLDPGGPDPVDEDRLDDEETRERERRRYRGDAWERSREDKFDQQHEDDGPRR